MASSILYRDSMSPSLFLMFHSAAPPPYMDVTLACRQGTPDGRPHQTNRYPNVTADQFEALRTSGSPYHYFKHFFLDGVRPYFKVPLRI